MLEVCFSLTALFWVLDWYSWLRWPHHASFQRH